VLDERPAWGRTSFISARAANANATRPLGRFVNAQIQMRPIRENQVAGRDLQFSVLVRPAFNDVPSPDWEAGGKTMDGGHGTSETNTQIQHQKPLRESRGLRIDARASGKSK